MPAPASTAPASTAAANAAEALAHVASGGRAFVATALSVTVIDKKALRRFEKAGEWLLKDDADGEGIRLRSGRGSIYLFAGQLRLTA